MLSNSIPKRQIQIDGINKYISTLKTNIIGSDKLNDEEAALILNIIDNTASLLINENRNDECYYSIQDFALRIGVSVSTLRLWDKCGKLSPHHRTAGGHRVYSEEQAVQYITNNFKTRNE